MRSTVSTVIKALPIRHIHDFPKFVLFLLFLLSSIIVFLHLGNVGLQKTILVIKYYVDPFLWF